MEHHKLMSWCKEVGVPPSRAIILGKVPIDTEDAVIYQALGTVKIFGKTIIYGRHRDSNNQTVSVLVRVAAELDPQCVPPEVGIVDEIGPWPVFLPGTAPQEQAMSAGTPDFMTKLDAWLQQEGKTLEDVRAIVTPESTPPAATNEGLITVLGQLVERCTRQPYEGVGYRKLRFFSGIKPTPAGEDDFESWMDQATQMMEEWQCPDNIKRQRLAESLRGPASDVIRSLRTSNPAAGAMEYLHALDDIYGTTESGEELYLRFRSTYQEDGEKLSQYICRLDKLLHRVLVKKGILDTRVNQVRMEQVLKGACPGNLIALKLQLSNSLQNPPSFSSLVRDVREEEDRLAARETGRIPVASVCTLTSVAPHDEIADLKKGLLCLTEQVNQLLRLSTGVEKPDRSSQSQRRDATVRDNNSVADNTTHSSRGSVETNRSDIFCYKCGEDGHTKRDCDAEEDLRKVARKLIQARKNSGNFKEAQ
ncbi:paraneoplastic antigen Ma1 homolog [Emydura macquarii macquarii]|uniref:paraneoplastic antigen Ma1 homolog n=1 Tax=Emydura macquarii macquarii TaxID=1129001 RepID=UPI00352ADFBA